MARIVAARSWAVMPVRSAEMIDGNREVRSQRGRIILHHGVEIESAAEFRQQGHAELPPAIEHEIDDFRSDLFGRADKIAFIFAIFGIHRDDNFAATHGVYRRLNTRQSLRHALLVLNLGLDNRQIGVSDKPCS